MKHLRKHAQRQSFCPSSEAVGDRCSPWMRVSEPYWMQDVRLATRRIESQREAGRGDSEPAAHPANED